jgi:2-methylcitrate dehydratase PrpD
MGIHILTALSDFYSGLRYEDLPEEVAKKTRRSLLDFLAVLAVGYKAGKLTPIINEYIRTYQGLNESTVLGLNIGVPAYFAALSMGVMSHSVELDDGHRFGTAHPAVAVTPPVLALSEKYNKPFKEVLLSIAIGYDTMLRLATAINPSHLTRGFHSTGTCGCIGSSFASAKLLKYSRDKMVHTVAIGGLKSSGIQEMLHDNPSIKPLQAGNAAAAGIMAAELAELGARGPRSLFEGQLGWLGAMSDDVDVAYITADLGQHWEIMDTYTKLYPTCRHCHAAIDLALEAYREFEGKTSLNDVEQITVKTYDVAIKEVGNIACPQSFEEAMFSLPFSVALALIYGKVSLEQFSDDVLNNEDVMKLASKIVIRSNKKMNKVYPEQRGASISISLSGGREYSACNELPKGEKEIPLSDSELYSKMINICTPYYPKSFCDQLWDLIIDKKVDQPCYGDIMRIFGGF